MRTVTIFANSSGYVSYESPGNVGELSYIQLLKNNVDIEVKGYWTNGMTILHTRNIMKRNLIGVIRSDLNWLILHVGVCESFSRYPQNFIQLVIDYLFQWGESSPFRSYVLPSAVKAAKDLAEGIEGNYYNFLDKTAFINLWREVFKLGEGHSIIVIGFSRPNIEENHPHFNQAREYNDVLRELTLCNDSYFIDAWNMVPECVVDGTHIAEKGHNRLYYKIMGIING